MSLITAFWVLVFSCFLRSVYNQSEEAESEYTPELTLDFTPVSPPDSFNGSPDDGSSLSPLDSADDDIYTCDGNTVRSFCIGCDKYVCHNNATEPKLVVCDTGSHCGCAYETETNCQRASCKPGNCEAIKFTEPESDTVWHQNETRIFRWALNSENKNNELPTIPLFIYIDDGYGGPYQLLCNGSYYAAANWDVPHDQQTGKFRVSIQGRSDPKIYDYIYPLVIKENIDGPDGRKEPNLTMILYLAGGVGFLLLVVGGPYLWSIRQSQRPPKKRWSKLGSFDTWKGTHRTIKPARSFFTQSVASWKDIEQPSENDYPPEPGIVYSDNGEPSQKKLLSEQVSRYLNFPGRVSHDSYGAMFPQTKDPPRFLRGKSRILTKSRADDKSEPLLSADVESEGGHSPGTSQELSGEGRRESVHLSPY